MISLIGICVSTMALIVVLSVLNGFEKVTLSLFSTFDSEILIEPKQGKTFHLKEFPLEKIEKLQGVKFAIPCVEESAMLSYKQNQQIVRLKGTTSDYEKMTHFNKYIMKGDFHLHDEYGDYGILGAEINYLLGVQHNDFANPIKVYLPKKDFRFGLNAEEAFNTGMLLPAGVFQVSAETDGEYVLVPLHFVQTLMGYADDEVSSLELGFAEGTNIAKIQKEIQKIVGENFTAKTREEQEELYFQTANIERLAIYIIMSFIIFIATFNIVGSLSLLMLDKSADIRILKSMGAGTPFVQRIFFLEGLLTSTVGALIGLFLGGVLCFLQQTFNFISIGDENFVVNAFPVHLQAIDFLIVFLLVSFIATLSVGLTVKTKLR